jgi:hypothetical protein
VNNIDSRNHQRDLNLENELKLGTGQFSDHAPKYQGFVPAVRTATKAFDHGKGKNVRNTILK